MEPFEYKEGNITYVAGPAIRKKAQMKSTPIPHALLIRDRPALVNILSIARDAVARLPQGVGTRLDVTELAKDS